MAGNEMDFEELLRRAPPIMPVEKFTRAGILALGQKLPADIAEVLFVADTLRCNFVDGLSVQVDHIPGIGDKIPTRGTIYVFGLLDNNNQYSLAYCNELNAETSLPDVMQVTSLKQIEKYRSIASFCRFD
jgi:hypothetical protein